MHLVLRINYPKTFPFSSISMRILIHPISMGEFDVVFTTSVVLRRVTNMKKAIFRSFIVYTTRTRTATPNLGQEIDRRNRVCDTLLLKERILVFCSSHCLRRICFLSCHIIPSPLSAAVVALSHSRFLVHFIK